MNRIINHWDKAATKMVPNLIKFLETTKNAILEKD